MTYQLILDCYLSGQISESQWILHLKNENFARWVDRKQIEKLRKLNNDQI